MSTKVSVVTAEPRPVHMRLVDAPTLELLQEVEGFQRLLITSGRKDNRMVIFFSNTGMSWGSASSVGNQDIVVRRAPSGSQVTLEGSK